LSTDVRATARARVNRRRSRERGHRHRTGTRDVFVVIVEISRPFAEARAIAGVGEGSIDGRRTTRARAVE